jgi:hypothetical protein
VPKAAQAELAAHQELAEQKVSAEPVANQDLEALLLLALVQTEMPV